MKSVSVAYRNVVAEGQDPPKGRIHDRKRPTTGVGFEAGGCAHGRR
jgi:hypothetical protein